SPGQCVADSAGFSLVGKLRLVGIELARPPFVDHALAVGEQNVLARHAKSDVMLGGRYGGRAGTGKDNADLLDLLADDLDGVEQGCAGDDGSAMLIIVEDRNLHRLPQ